MNQFSVAVGVARYVWTHPANRGRRIRSLARAALFQVRGRVGVRTLARIGEQGRMWAILHRSAAANVLYANPPDWNEMTAWRRLLSDGDLFVDVGSNVGSYALWAADCGAEVIAVEPSTATADLLRANVSLNRFPICVVRCALANASGEMNLTETFDSMNHLLLESSDLGERVAVITLDQLLDGRVATGIKVDVEGVERLVLEGARVSLSQERIKIIQLEWNEMSHRVLGEDREPVAAILDEFGYRFFRPDINGVLRPSAERGYGPDIFAVSPGYDLSQ